MQRIGIIETTIILSYIGFTIYLVYRFSRKADAGDAAGFLLAGRRLTLPMFVATIVSTWYGGILGVGEFSYRYGISNWLVFGVPYYLSAFFFAIFMAKRARKVPVLTIPDQMDKTYGRFPSYVSALFVFFMTSPAPYVLMLGVLLNFFFQWPLWLGVSVGAVFSMVYVFIGGFRSVVRTDMLQFAMMFIGFIFIIAFAASQYGGLTFVRESIPKQHFVWHGGNGAAYIIVWFFISLQTFVEPSFYQRCFAAQNENVARNGIFVSILFWLLFDFLTTSAGLYARALFPDLENPVTSYLFLSQKVLPPVLAGIFLAGMIATIMSTLDSYTFISGMTLGRDFMWALFESREERITLYTRIGIVLTTGLSILIALYARSVIQIWKDLGSIATPALIFPVVTSYFPRFKMRPHFAGLAMTVAGGIAFLWTFSNPFGLTSQNYLFNIEPIYPGLVAASLIFLSDRFTRYKET